MSGSAPRRHTTSTPALWLLATAALVLLVAVDLVVLYGALRLSEALTHHSRPPWALLGSWLLALASAATLLGDPLAHSGRTALLITLLYAPCFGYGLTQALADYGPALAHTAARLLYSLSPLGGGAFRFRRLTLAQHPRGYLEVANREGRDIDILQNGEPIGFGSGERVSVEFDVDAGPIELRPRWS